MISILGVVVAGICVRSPWWLELLVFLIVGLGLYGILSLAIFVRRRVFNKGSSMPV